MSRQVVLVGGIGGSEAVYRACVESLGCQLAYHEKSKPAAPHTVVPGRRLAPVEQVAAIVVFTRVCSHPQREAAERLATALRLPVRYVRQPSLSALRRALEDLRQEGAGAAR